MTRLLYFVLFVALGTTPIYSQCSNGRLDAEVWGEIENDHRHNNAFSYGMVSYQSHADNFYYESAEEPAFYLGYGKSIWVGARDATGELRVAANTFPFIGRHDFLPGPLDRTTGQPIDTVCNVYNRVWTVKNIDIFQIQVKFQQGELTLEDIPTDILEWPAKGNLYLEEFSPDYDLAPFADIDEDGIYNPLSGDYPIALEESPEFVPHQFSFIVFNDMGRHLETNSESLGMEFQQINYLVNCSEESESEYSVFTRIKYNYLGQEPMTDFKLALWEDSDLACNQNDYEGCDRELNCTYFYNQNGETFTEECHDPDVPDNNGAIRTTVFFSQEMKSFQHWFLLGVGDTIIPAIDPSGAQEYYNYMSAQWRFGEPLTVGGNGYNPGSTDTTLFAFPDRPNNPNGWSMQTAQLPVPLDCRALTTLVDESEIMPGASGILDFADHFLYDKENKRLEVFDVWPARIQALKSDYAAMINGDFNCGGNLEICIEECVWPGDANNDLAVTGKDFLITGLLSGLNLTDGIPRNTSSTEWFGFAADDWNFSLGDLNAKNADVNGNGTINVNDLAGIADNFGKTRGDYIPSSVLTTKVDTLGLRVELEVDIVDLATATQFDQIVNTNLSIGNLAKAISAPIHGLSFDMRFDTNLVRPYVRIDEIISNVFEYNFAAMLNQERSAANLLEGDDKISYAYTNLSGAEITEGGLLANQNLFVRGDAATVNANGVDTLVLKFYNVCAVDAEGNLVEMGISNDTLILTNLRVDPDLISATENLVEETQMRLYPNPVSDVLTLDFDESRSGKITIFNIQGQELMTSKIVQKDQHSMNVSTLMPGIYLVQFKTKEGPMIAKSFVVN